MVIVLENYKDKGVDNNDGDQVQSNQQTRYLSKLYTSTLWTYHMLPESTKFATIYILLQHSVKYLR